MNIPEDLNTHPANLLDLDNRILSSGAVRFYISELTGTFYPVPPDPIPVGILELVKSVKTRDGYFAPISQIKLCPAGLVHYDLEFESSSKS